MIRYLLSKRVSYKSDESTLRVYTDNRRVFARYVRGRSVSLEPRVAALIVLLAGLPEELLFEVGGVGVQLTEPHRLVEVDDFTDDVAVDDLALALRVDHVDDGVRASRLDLVEDDALK